MTDHDADPTGFDQGNPLSAATPQSDNPLGGGFDFSLRVPDLEVRMVNAGALEDYEWWIFASSLSFSGVTGFAVAYIQSIQTVNGKHTSDPALLLMTALLAVLFVAFLVRAVVLRRRLAADAQTYRMRATRHEAPHKPKAEE